MTDAGTSGLLPATVPAGAAVALAAAGFGVWLGLRLLTRGVRKPPLREIAFLVRAASGALMVWLLLSALGRVFSFETGWNLRIFAAAGGLAVETVLGLYRLEQTVLTRKYGLIVGGLRVALVLLVVLLAAEMVVARHTVRKEERFVAVLVDDSRSMYLSDPQATVSEKLAAARVLLPDLPARVLDVAETAGKLRAAAGRLGGLEPDAAGDTGQKTLELNEKRSSVLREAAEAANQARQAITSFPQASKLGKEPADALTQAAHLLNVQVYTPLKDVPGTGKTGLNAVSDARAALETVAKELVKWAEPVDSAYLASLSAEQQKAADEAAGKARRAIARAGLSKGDPKPLDVLGSKYALKVYYFNREVTETSVATLLADKPAEGNDEARLCTDLASALERVRADIPDSKLAGILIISDGRHNGEKAIEPEGRRLAVQGVPVCSVFVGSRRRPMDCAISDITAPRVVQVKDRMVIQAEVKLDGVKDQEMTVELVRDGKPLDQKKVRATEDAFRKTVELTDQPEQPGFAGYEIRVAAAPGERMVENNAKTIYVQVSDNPTKLLLIEGRPRWEFRYIRNLFADRDKSVKLQHVLFNPDTIDGMGPRAAAAASTKRAPGEAEASALPASEEEWLLFDAVILGDVSPERLGPNDLKILEKFVRERGGRIVVIAGPNYMPHAFESPLREMLPFEFEPSKLAVMLGPELAYQATLTPAGEQHVVTRLSEAADVNRMIWSGFPELYWRHPIRGVKPGAEVLAFAMPYPAPEIFSGRDAGRPAEAAAREREDFMRSHGIIAVQKYGAGQVMMLSFDATWRFRYWRGDTYHHRFWGQVMRWATADNLAAGNSLARLGTDQAVYGPAEPVRIRARLRGDEGKTVAADDASVAIYKDKAEVMRKKLRPAAESGGMYEAEPAALEPGRYRIALDVRSAENPALEAAARGVETEIVVASGGEKELAELSADSTILDQLAQAGGGVVVAPERVSDVMDHFGFPTREIREEKRFFLWRSWPLFVLMVVVVSSEWIIRKKAGLA